MPDGIPGPGKKRPAATGLARTRRARWRALLLFAALALGFPVPVPAGQWYKGNLHTHTLWSDGDHFPEMIVEWYRTNHYHFLTLSDHNILQTGEKWVPVRKAGDGWWALERYLERFGPDWVRRREMDGVAQVRLRTLEEIRPEFEAPGKFLLLTGEEITARYKTLPLHMNAYPVGDLIRPLDGTNVVDVLQRNVDQVREHRARTGLPTVIHVNHPNFGYGITAEELMQIRGERFFEVYNGHPQVHNEGDAYHASTDRMWDIMLAFRLTKLELGPVYGLAVDDSHNYEGPSVTQSNPGRGWVMVWASELSADALIAALEAGDFYASSGVRLKSVTRREGELSLVIEGEPGVTYATQFIGTRQGFDETSQAGQRPPSGSFPVTRQYSEEIGRVFSEQTGLEPSYRMKGDELYVRAKVVSSKPKENPYREGEVEQAWVQPLLR